MPKMRTSLRLPLKNGGKLAVVETFNYYARDQGGYLLWRRTSDLEEVGQAHCGLDTSDRRKVVAVSDSLWIDESLQGVGNGRLLCQRIEAVAREFGAKEFKVTHVLAASEDFWQEMGYSPVEETRRVWAKYL